MPWKKRCELETLRYFFEALYYYTGNTDLVLNEITERPDFVCTDKHGQRFGLEIVSITRGDPDIILFDKYVHKLEFMSPYLAIDRIQELAEKKDNKRREEDWMYPDNSFLLIHLTDVPLSHIFKLINKENTPDLYCNGFVAIWIIDTTGLEAFGDVELFCVKPEAGNGYYSRGLQKPYG